jgi:hypothetical protein
MCFYVVYMCFYVVSTCFDVVGIDSQIMEQGHCNIDKYRNLVKPLMVK